MPTHSGDDECPLGHFLASDIGHIGHRLNPCFGVLCSAGSVCRQGLLPTQVGHGLGQLAGCADDGAIGEDCFLGVAVGKEQLPACGAGRQGSTQSTGNRTQASIQGEFTDAFRRSQGRHRDLTTGRKDTQGDGQIEATALFGQICRGEVDDDASRRKIQAAILDGRAYAVAGLLHRRLGEPDDGKGGQPRAEIALDHHFGSLNTGNRPTLNDCQGHESVRCGRFAGRSFVRRMLALQAGDALFQCRQTGAESRYEILLDVEILAGNDVQTIQSIGHRGPQLLVHVFLDGTKAGEGVAEGGGKIVGNTVLHDRLLRGLWPDE